MKVKIILCRSHTHQKGWELASFHFLFLLLQWFCHICSTHIPTHGFELRIAFGPRDASLFANGKTYYIFFWKQFKCLLTDIWVDKEDTAYMYIYSEVLVSHQTWNLVIYDNLDGLWGHYAKWNQSDGKRQIPYDFILVEYIKQTKKQITEQTKSNT